MFGDNELKLLGASWIAEFPLLRVAAAMARKCKTCGHKNINPAAALQIAVERYCKDPKFIEKCGELFKLPVSISGVVIK